MTANKIKRALKGNKLNYANIEKILNTIGYSVVLFNTIQGDEEIKRYNLTKQADTLKSFTYSRTVKIVFADATLPSDDIVYLLLHELGHIMCGHIGNGNAGKQNKILMDIEADNFAHSILYKSERNYLYILFSAIILSISIIIAADCIKSTAVPAQTTTTEPAIITTETPETITDKVYVTPSGKKYHRRDCYYVRDKKNITELSTDEATRAYLPCSVCNPQ